MSARPILRLTSVACAFGLGCGNPAYLPEEPPPFDSADLGADGAGDGAGDGASDGGEASMGCSAATPGNTDQLIVQSGLDRDAEVYWVDFDCVEQPYGVVVAGGVWQVTTGGGHVWAFRELGSLAYIDHVVVEGDGETTFVLE